MDKIRKIRNIKTFLKIILSLLAVALFCCFLIWGLKQLGIGFAEKWKDIPVYIPKIK